MNDESIQAAAAEARRFLDRVKDWKCKQSVDSHGWPTSTPVQDGALRRASMDLTRSLAVMRRPS